MKRIINTIKLLLLAAFGVALFDFITLYLKGNPRFWGGIFCGAVIIMWRGTWNLMGRISDLEKFILENLDGKIKIVNKENK